MQDKEHQGQGEEREVERVGDDGRAVVVVAVGQWAFVQRALVAILRDGRRVVLGPFHEGQRVAYRMHIDSEKRYWISRAVVMGKQLGKSRSCIKHHLSFSSMKGMVEVED